MKIRRFSLEDSERITKFLFTATTAEQVRESYSEIVDDPDRRHLVVEIEGELHATVMLMRDSHPMNHHRGVLYGFVVSPKYRGKGIAEELQKSIELEARKMSISLLTLSTWETNERAIAFYKKVGFNVYGRLPKGTLNKKGNGYETEILMYKILD